MTPRQTIVIWDLSAERLRTMEANVRMAMKKLGVQADVQLNSEEPLLSRHHLIGHTPAIQINGGEMWRCVPGQAVTEDEFVNLFTMLNRTNRLVCSGKCS